MKKYVSNTSISVSVTLAGGGNARVSFSPLTDGRSVYYTDDKEIQWGLEHHYQFGKLFRLDSNTEAGGQGGNNQKARQQKGRNTTAKGAVQETKMEDSPEDKPMAGSIDAEGVEAALKEVTVTDLDAAKDYLAENYDVVRTKLKSEEMIKSTALAYGIIFKIL